MKKILQINVVANWGSTGRISEDIGKIIQDQGDESFIAYGRKAGPSKSDLIRIGSDKDVKLHVLNTRLSDKHGLCSSRATRIFIEKIKSLNPDIIHLHNIHGYYLNYPILFKYLEKADIPVVWTLHDCWALTGHCAYFTYQQCEKWKYGCSHCPQLNAYPRSLFIDRSYKNYKEKKKYFTSVKNMVLVPVSDWLTNLLSQSFMNQLPVKRIYNGIDTKVFYPMESRQIICEKYKIQAEFIILGIANIWSPRKGLNDFFKLREKLSQNYQIILVGLSKHQIKNLPKGIIGINRTENLKELAEIYSCVNVYINPTWEDNFPTTNIEALACGVPVITYNTGGSGEAISSTTGFVVEPGNIEELKEKIEIVKKAGKQNYINPCRERVLQYFRKEECYKNYLKLYEEILNRKFKKN